MPEWKQEVRARLAGLRLAPAREAEIVEELSQHLEDRWRELVAGGSDPDEATRLSIAEFREHNVLARYMAPLRQSHWADPAPPVARGWVLVSGLRTDLRDAVRALRTSPGSTIAALLVLTLGIGASTAIFSVVDAVVLRGLPFDESDRLVAVGERSLPGKSGKPMLSGLGRPPGIDPGDPQALSRVKPQNYLDWTAQQHVFESIAAIADGDFTMRLPGEAPEAVVAQRVTASFFDVLRIRPALGRTFTAESEVDGRHRVVVLSDALWRRRFDAHSDILGQTIALEDGGYEVIGVMPAALTYPVAAIHPTDLWVPYVISANERTRGRGFSIYLHCVARLKTGVSVAEAQANMDQIASALEQAYPQWNRGNRVGVRPLRDHLVGASTKSWMLMLLASVGIVLLITCANVANLLLARASVREREVAVRAALGASRWRLVRQLMVESLVLSAAGTALAVVLSFWAVQVLRRAMPEDLPRVMTIAVDLRVLFAAAAIALVTGLLFGIVPAWHSSRLQLTNALKDGTYGAGSGRARQRLRGALVIGEVALAVILLVGAALFIGSFVRLMRVDPGFNPDRVLTAQVYQRALAGQRPPDIGAALAQTVEQVRQREGVVNSAAVSPGIPLRVQMQINGFDVRGRTIEGDRAVSIKVVTPEYHRTLGIPLRRGRFFDATDRQGTSGVMIISEAAAKAFFPGEDPIGRVASVDRNDRTIVGVVGDARQWGLEFDSRPEAYVPMAQSQAASGYLVIRSTIDPHELLPDVRSEALRSLPNIALRYVATMDELMAGQTAQRRLNMLMLGLFGLLGLVISAVGVYGVLAYVVSQRTREIGVRIALGAKRSQVVGMVLRNAGALVMTGLAIGSAAAWYLAVNPNKFLFGLEGRDARAFAAAIVSLSIAALFASLIPARRAASVDPAVTLRSE